MSRFIFFLIFSMGSLFSAEKKLVLVSIPPYQTIIQKIAGREVEIITVVPPSSDPHTYEPTAKQIGKLASASLWFQIGEPFEKKMSPLIHAPKIDLSDQIKLLPLDDHHHTGCCHDEMDRHIWLSIKDMNAQAKKITAVLKELVPEKKEIFEQNFLKLKSELDLLDQEIGTALSELKTRSFIVSHPAFAYFCRDYKLNQMSVEHEGKEPRPKELEALLQAADRNHPSVAITIPQHNNRGTELIAKRLKIPVQSIDPYSQDYFGTLKELANVLKDSN